MIGWLEGSLPLTITCNPFVPTLVVIVASIVEAEARIWSKVEIVVLLESLWFTRCLQPVALKSE